MDNSLKERWYSMSIGEQIGNIGGEVHRAIKYKNKNDDIKALSFVNKALDFLDETMKDPKNRMRIGELSSCKDELIDYFIGNNIYQTTDDVLIRYYDAWIM